SVAVGTTGLVVPRVGVRHGHFVVPRVRAGSCGTQKRKLLGKRAGEIRTSSSKVVDGVNSSPVRKSCKRLSSVNDVASPPKRKSCLRRLPAGDVNSPSARKSNKRVSVAGSDTHEL
ncbi:unnamed protein product, partial [Pylaiella littoralis]